MNAKDLLNKTLYPSGLQNARRKEYNYYDTLAITTGILSYFFFQTALGNIFARNKRLPLSGSEIFLVDGIAAYIETPITTPALLNSLNELLQQSYLQISVDGRVQAKLPGMDFIQYMLVFNEDATPERLLPIVETKTRNLPIPIFMNSTSSFEFQFVTTAAAATAFNGINMRLVLNGVQIDKLDSYYYDAVKNNKFQQISTTYYNTVAIPNGNEQTFQLFADANQANNLYSKVFPLSDITTMQIQNIEVLFNQPDVPIDPITIYNSRLNNILVITVDDVDIYRSNLVDTLSVVAGFAGNITDSAAATTAYNMFMNVRQSKTLRIPVEIPANSNVSMQLIQPGSSLGITGEFTVALRGVETRKLA